MEAWNSILSWLAPIISTLVICAGQLTLNERFRLADEKRDLARADTDAKRAAEAEWRDSVDMKLAEIEGKVDRSTTALAAQTRSDIIHKCHRYLDDLGKASIEEKQDMYDEHKQYAQFCDDLDIENSFIDDLVQRVMELPERDV